MGKVYIVLRLERPSETSYSLICSTRLYGEPLAMYSHLSIHQCACLITEGASAYAPRHGRTDDLVDVPS